MTTEERLVKVAENREKIYEAGENAGKQAEHDTFWDAFQKNGARTDYTSAFAGTWWTGETFRPKYDIKPTNAGNMFYQNTTLNVDLVDLLNECGVTFDTSNCTSATNMFAVTYIKHVGEINLTKLTSIALVFFRAWGLVTIDKFIINETGTVTFTSAFDSCSLLQNIVIEGKIGRNISFSSATNLTVESMKSIILHLVDYAGTTSASTYSVKFNAQALARLKAEGATSPSGGLWTDYIEELGWTY